MSRSYDDRGRFTYSGMSRSYDRGRLAYIECDRCDAKIRPHPDIAKSGWTRVVSIVGWFEIKLEADYCPSCADKRLTP